MIQIQHLTITHTKDLRELVHDLNLTIATGEKVAIIGEEGNGKSSLLTLLVNPKAHFDHLSYEGTINKPDSPQVYIPQQISDDLQSLTLNDYFFADTYDLDYATLYRLADELHFDSDRFASSQLISSLSGGEKLKIQLIRELARPHDIIFLDEPSNDMDLTTMTWLKNFIKHSDQTIIYISHDEDLLSQTADTIIHLELLKRRRQARTSVEHLDYDNYSQQRTDAFQQQMQQAKTEKKAYDKAMAKHLRIKQNVQTTLRNTHDSTQGRLVAKKMKAVLSQEKRYDRLAQDMTQMPDKEDSIELFFSHITPLPQGKYLLNLDKKQINIDVYKRQVVICDSYCLDVVFVSCIKFSCIQPYLVVKFLTTFNCLGIQVFQFVVVSCIDIWIGVCFTIFICQFRIIINEFSTSDIEFRFRNNVFLWLELRFFWRYILLKIYCKVSRKSCFLI